MAEKREDFIKRHINIYEMSGHMAILSVRSMNSTIEK